MSARPHTDGASRTDTRILLADDDRDVLRAFARALAADGHRVSVAADGASALEALADAVHDVVLVDIGLRPGPDGLDVCRRLRQVDTHAYVIMLAAGGAESDVVRGLEAGADDCLTKPIGISELRSRVHAVLRRMAPRARVVPVPDRRLRHGELVLDPSARSVTFRGLPVPLTPSELAILEALLRAGGAVRDRAELVAAIHGDIAYRDPRGVDVHVHNLRRKLRHRGADPGWLVTVRGVGYRLAPGG